MQPEGRDDTAVTVLVCWDEGTVMQCAWLAACLGRALRVSLQWHACQRSPPLLPMTIKLACAFRDRGKCTMVGTGVSHKFPGCVARKGVHLCYHDGTVGAILDHA